VDEDLRGQFADELVDFCLRRLPFERGRWMWWKTPQVIYHAGRTKPQGRDLEDRYRAIAGVSPRQAVGTVEYAIRLIGWALVEGIVDAELRSGARALIQIFDGSGDDDPRLVELERHFDADRRPTRNYTEAWRQLSALRSDEPRK